MCHACRYLLQVPSETLDRRIALVVCLLVVGWILAIYLPGLGRGFIRDDFAWIAESTVSSLGECARFFQPTTGFYRPLVSLSFAADRALFGVAPLPYALTNFALYGLCGVAVFLLARAFELPRTAGIAAAGLWALNHHGINTTILWICGRTALLLTLFAVLAAGAFKRRDHLQVFLFTLLAMLSKEEAVLLPLIFLVWSVIDARLASRARRSEPAGPGPSAESQRSQESRARSLKLALAACVPFVALAIYAWLHTGSGAVTPSTAPEGYRLAIVPARLARHVFEYTDRTCTLSVVLLVLTAVAAGRGVRTLRVRGRLIAEMSIWVVGLYALTIFLPLRSGLYVLAPSAGVAIVAGAWVSDILFSLDVRRLGRVAAIVAAVAIATVPIYWARNAPNIKRAALTTVVLDAIVPVLESAPRASAIVVHDRRNGPATLEDAFGTLAPEAGRLFAGRQDVTVWIDPPSFDATVDGFRPPDPATVHAEFVLDGGRISRK